MPSVFQNDHQAVAVGVETLGFAGAHFHDRSAAAGIDVGRTTMMHAGGGNGHSPAARNPEPPGEVKFITEHEKFGIKFAKRFKQCPADRGTSSPRA